MAGGRCRDRSNGPRRNPIPESDGTLAMPGTRRLVDRGAPGVVTNGSPACRDRHPHWCHCALSSAHWLPRRPWSLDLPLVGGRQPQHRTDERHPRTSRGRVDGHRAGSVSRARQRPQRHHPVRHLAADRACAADRPAAGTAARDCQDLRQRWYWDCHRSSSAPCLPCVARI